MKKHFVLGAACVAVLAGVAGADPILSSGDFIIAVNPKPAVVNSSYPGGEAPAKAIDQNLGTKYLNFGKLETGFIVTPGLSLVDSMVLTTANDDERRDPSSWVLYGTNDPILSTDNSGGLAENWDFIDAGGLSLPAARNTVAPTVSIANATMYSSYKLIFPTIKNTAANSMQINEVQFFSGATPVLNPANPILAVANPRPASRYPDAEAPANLLDGLVNTKYLNFAEDQSGFIVTPASGPSVARSLLIATANDAVERDPTSFEIYGTNDPIMSSNNSQGTSENWTLIASGALNLPDARMVYAGIVAFDNDTEYTSYKVLFPTVKNGAAANSMQISEFQLMTVVPEPASMGLLAVGALALLRRRVR